MNFDHIDFTQRCHVDLFVDGYGSVSGITFFEKNTLSLMASLFMKTGVNPVILPHKYAVAYIGPANVEFCNFMKIGVNAINEEAKAILGNNGEIKQLPDFWDVWEDNEISQIAISFPIKSLSEEDLKDSDKSDIARSMPTFDLDRVTSMLLHESSCYTPLLLVGATGTGKTLISKRIKSLNMDYVRVYAEPSGYKSLNAWIIDHSRNRNIILDGLIVEAPEAECLLETLFCYARSGRRIIITTQYVPENFKFIEVFTKAYRIERPYPFVREKIVLTDFCFSSPERHRR
ncbi:hypothetical protein WH357_21325 [Enterobacter ludwigii]